MKSLANYISVSRIVLSLTLFLTEPLSPVFILIYLIIGLSDILDGYIARKTRSTSRLGEKLDSFADMAFDFVLIIILYPVIKPKTEILIWIALIALIRITAIAVVYKKYRIPGMVHTLANKATGLALFLFPILYSIFRSEYFIYFVCLIASVSAVEELIIDLTSNKWLANRKSILVKEKDA
jgi:CDP-diacylglycerol--glycerol-3-phosphate 3-phosphatidyltransferase